MSETEKKELAVEVLGKGQSSVQVDDETTVKDLRDLLLLDKDVTAVDEKGNELSEHSKVSTQSKVSFAPNVAGGL